MIEEEWGKCRIISEERQGWEPQKIEIKRSEILNFDDDSLKITQKDIVMIINPLI